MMNRTVENFNTNANKSSIDDEGSLILDFADCYGADSRSAG